MVEKLSPEEAQAILDDGHCPVCNQPLEISSAHDGGGLMVWYMCTGPLRHFYHAVPDVDLDWRAVWSEQ